jgi:hypothetical protein
MVFMGKRKPMSVETAEAVVEVPNRNSYGGGANIVKIASPNGYIYTSDGSCHVDSPFCKAHHLGEVLNAGESYYQKALDVLAKAEREDCEQIFEASLRENNRPIQAFEDDYKKLAIADEQLGLA